MYRSVMELRYWMLTRTLILLPAAGFVVAAATGMLIRTRRKREDKLRREDFRNVCKLEDELSHHMTAKD
jgi:hypothetical protein